MLFSVEKNALKCSMVIFTLAILLVFMNCLIYLAVEKDGDHNP